MLTMRSALLSPIDYPLILNPSSLVTCPSLSLSPFEPHLNLAHNVLADDPQKVVKVIASNGKSGDQCELSYTNCKVVGNGSFGVVFQAKLVNGSLADDGGDDDVAIKKVLQDKRFKVGSFPLSPHSSHSSAPLPALAGVSRVWRPKTLSRDGRSDTSSAADRNLHHYRTVSCRS